MEYVIEKLKLRKATKKDFIEFSHLKADKKGKVYKMKYGMPYWLLNSKGEIESCPYRTHENMDMQEFQIYMVHEQVLIINFC